MEKGEKHHHKRRIAKMEVVSNLCANREEILWPKMKEDVEHFVSTYVKCQNMKSIYKKKYGLYMPLPILNEPWENVSMNFMM